MLPVVIGAVKLQPAKSNSPQIDRYTLDEFRLLSFGTLMTPLSVPSHE